jgi:hypothetical protein
MAQETQLHLHNLLAAAELDSTSVSETSLSGDEGTNFIDEDEKGSEADQNDTDIEKGDDTPFQHGKRKTNSLQFLGWTIVNTLATIGIVSEQPATLKFPLTGFRFSQTRRFLRIHHSGGINPHLQLFTLPSQAPRCMQFRDHR